MRSFLIIHSLIAIILTNYCHSQIFAPDQKKIISELARNRKVIAVGEETHFKKSLVDARIKIIKELVTEHQIDIIAIEGSINVSHIINEYVSGQTQSIIFHEVLPGLNEPYLLQGAGLYDCEQMIEFIEWLREFNSKRKNKITFAGFDFQNFSVPIDSLQKYSNGDIEINYKLSSIQTTLRKSILSILDSGINVIATRNWLETFRSARKDLKYVERQIFSDENAIFFDELKQFTNLWDAPSFPRDSLMFENLKKISRNENVIVLAANYHLENDPLFKGPKKMGTFLREYFNENYLAIGLKEDQNSAIRLKNPKIVDDKKLDIVIFVSQGEKCNRIYRK